MKNKHENRGTAVDLRKLLYVYRRDWWVILLSGVICAVAVLVCTWLLITPVYQATATLYVDSVKSSRTAEDVEDATPELSQQMVDTCINIISSDRVLSKAVRDLDMEDISTEDVKEMLTAGQVTTTDLFRISILHPNAEAAARICNAIARVSPEMIATVLEGSSSQVIDYAAVPTSLYSPHYVKNAVVGGIIGIVIAVVFLTLHFLMDVRIKDEEELLQAFAIPVLGQIPSFTETGRWFAGYGRRAQVSGGAE